MVSPFSSQPSLATRLRTASRFTPTTPYRRAVRSFVVPAKQSNLAVISTSVNPAAANTSTSSASSRAPAIQVWHQIFQRIDDDALGLTAAAEQIGGRDGRGVQELPNDHGPLQSRSRAMRAKCMRGNSIRPMK
jgi:hypothetical protein